jgi:hypothetical protein
VGLAVGVVVAVGVMVAVGVVVTAGVVGTVGVVPVSEGSPGATGEVVAVGVLPPPSHAPKIAAKLNITAKPKIFVFITPLSPIVAIKISCLLN